MWWGATIYFVMLGCVCGDKTVSATVENNTITTSSIPRSSTEKVISSVTSTSSTNFPSTQTFTLSPSTDVFVTPFSGESVISTNRSVLTKTVDVSSYESFSNSLETTSTSYDSNSTNTLQPDASSSPSPSQVTSVESLLLSSNSTIQVQSTTTENFSSSESVLPSTSTTNPNISTIASSFQKSSSIYPSSSETEILSTTTPSLTSVANYTTISNTVLSSTFPYTKKAPSPTSSNVVPSSQSVNTHVISTSYSDIESRSTGISPVLSQHDSISLSTETIKDTASVEVSSKFPSISSSVPSASSQYLQNETESVTSSLLTNGSASFSLSDITKISPQTTTPHLESFATQITETPLISSTASERTDSTFPFSSNDIFASKSLFASSVYTYPQESSTKTSIAPTSIKEITTQTQPPSSIQSSIHPTPIPPSSSIISSYSTFPVSTHSISSTKDTIIPYSASHYSQNVTSSSSHITTTTESIPTTQRTDGTSKDLVRVNHTFEMIFEGNCELLVKDESLLKTFWDQLQEKITHKLNDPKISVTAANIACKPLRIHVSFTLYQIPAIKFKLIFSSLKELVNYVEINVTIFGQTERYKAVQVNMAPSEMDKDKGGLDGFEEIDLIVLIAAGAFCLVLVSAGLVICIRESYRRKRTRTFELANKYQAEDFTLTKIPRPAVNYTEKGQDIHSNGHNSGDPSTAERETLMDSLHLRVNSNENGLMVGITGTLERQKAEPDSSPASSVTDSEHLKVPLVSRQDEPLHSQDNPIYYIDDEHID